MRNALKVGITDAVLRSICDSTANQREPLERATLAAAVRATLDEIRLNMRKAAILGPLADGVCSYVVLIHDGTDFVAATKIFRRVLQTTIAVTSDTTRIENEVAGLTYATTIRPVEAPRLLAESVIPAWVSMSTPKDQANNLRELMLRKVNIDPGVFGQLGSWLNKFHNGRLEDLSPKHTECVMRRLSFYEIRVFPFYAHVAQVLPEIAHDIFDVAAGSLENRVALVHGDFSPKNVLVLNQAMPWVIDYELFHYGDPNFDVASMLHFLILKRFLLPDQPISEYISRFLAGYFEGAPRDRIRADLLVGNLSVLLLARLHGRARVKYRNKLKIDKIDDLARYLMRMRRHLNSAEPVCVVKCIEEAVGKY